MIIFDKLKSLFIKEEPEYMKIVREIAQRENEINIAILKLGAKLCNADGYVSDEELTEFLLVFGRAESKTKNADRIFDSAIYSSQSIESIAQSILSNERNEDFLEFVLIGLARIAISDNMFHENEKDIIRRVGIVFGFGNDHMDWFIGETEKILYERINGVQEWDFENSQAHKHKDYKKRVAEYEQLLAEYEDLAEEFESSKR